MNNTKLRVNFAGAELDYEGSEEFLENKVQKLFDSINKKNNTKVREELLRFIDELQFINSQIVDSSKDQGNDLKKSEENVQNFIKELIEQLIQAKSMSTENTKLFQKISAMYKMVEQFMIDFIMLHNEVSYENRKFTTISNTMKTKHDEGKATINNLR